MTKFTQSRWEQISRTLMQGRESKANTAPVNSMLFERRREREKKKKAEFYLARATHKRRQQCNMASFKIGIKRFKLIKQLNKSPLASTAYLPSVFSPFPHLFFCCSSSRVLPTYTIRLEIEDKLPPCA